ncbi:MAG: EAL domain-containing protein [Brevundimonas sp.]|uniref:EAL domain-containing protein n=1 Tax=Brevundimonas sp. TaxID=1871086 RepID=UPI0017F4831E|nr:EAL domain-containing protein [Brevundimonas sp.]MBA4803296.1 EAL domain-containing protein [Brevundimonas sp.]
MKSPSRLLALAFASADLVFEVDPRGTVVVAMGAGPTPGVDPGALWEGRPLSAFLCKASRREAARALADVTPGVRSGPHDILVEGGGGLVRRGRLRLFQLPELAPAVSCAISWEGAAFPLAIPTAPPLLDAPALLDRTRALLTAEAAPGVAFVEVAGLEGDDEAHRRAADRVKAALQAASIDGASAARLTAERFAVVQAPDAPPDLAGDIVDAGAAEGVELAPEVAGPAALGGANAEAALRALRFTLEECLRSGPTTAAAGFGARLRETVREAERFRVIVRERDFTVLFQPVVDLSTGVTHHYEALSRFGPAGPSAIIQMAEELHLIEGFDLAVAEKALQQMRRPGSGLIKIAVNVSGRSLATDAYVTGLLRMTAAAPESRKRLLVEVTETAALKDLETANRRLKALRDAGVRICLDDFGVGAATFDYLGRLTLDAVKIDGSFVRDVVGSDRARILVSRLAGLCGDLGLESIAEMVETEDQARVVRELGVTHGQGWLFGRPEAEPRPAPAPAARLTGRGDQLAARG